MVILPAVHKTYSKNTSYSLNSFLQKLIYLNSYISDTRQIKLEIYSEIDIDLHSITQKCHFISPKFVNPNKAGLCEGNVFWGVNLTPPFTFQEDLT